MPEERIARSVSAALIVLTIAFAPLYMLFGFAFAAPVLFFGLGCTVVGIAASLLLGRRRAVFQLLASALPAAALALIVPVSIVRGALIARYAMMGAGALLAVWTERLALRPANPGRETGLLLAPLGVLFAVCAVIWLRAKNYGSAAQGMWTLLIAIGCIWFVVALFLLNRLALRRAAASGTQRSIPAGARRSGTVGVAVFAVAVFVLAGINTIVQAIAEAIKWLIARVVEVFLFLSSLFSSGMQAAPSPTGGQQDMQLPPPGEASPLMQLLSNIFLYAAVIAVAAAILYGLYKLLPKLWRKLLERFGRLASTWHQDEGYQDRSESLMNLRQALSDAGAGLRKFARRFRRRPRIGDYPTNAGKARFLFREYLHGLVSSGREPPPGATATDIARPAPALASAYNRARYAEEEPGDAEIDKAQQEIRQK